MARRRKRARRRGVVEWRLRAAREGRKDGPGWEIVGRRA